jgi:ADP-Ribosyltransferase in polyvalent proteins
MGIVIHSMPSNRMSKGRRAFRSTRRRSDVRDGLVFAEDGHVEDEQPLIEWFGQSRATEPDGTPAVLYRGEHGALVDDEYLQSRLNSLSFTADRDAANTYALSPNNSQFDSVAEAPRVTPVHLKIENPIIENHSDPFIDLSHLADKLGRREAKRIALKFDRDIRYTGNWEDNYAREYGSVAQLLKKKPNELKNLYFNAHKFLDDITEIERLKEAGYDGAIHIGNGETASVLEYRVFNPRQVRSALSGRSMFPQRNR